MIKGSCLCGRVTYEYRGNIEEIALCHCSQCRKAQGGAFATNSPVDATRLIFQGQENIREYHSSDNKVRAFCEHCGSALYSAKTDLPGIKRLRLGTVTSTFSCDNKYHIWADSKASGHEITDQYPAYSEAKT
ncbi:MAG: GFA family protein [Pseudomonadota bacterium]